MTELPTRHGTLWVRAHGTGQPRVVALHGFSLHGGMWSRFAEYLGEPVAAPDLPGHGRTTIQPITMGTAVDAVAELLARYDRPVLVGYSQGGRVALQVALTQPSLVGALALIGTSPGLQPRERRVRTVADEALAARIERIGMERFVDEWLANPLIAPDRAHPEERAADRRMRLENTAEGVAAALRGLGQASAADVSNRLSELSMPVAFIAGGLDDKYSALATAMAKTVGKHPVIVPDIGHNVVREAPQTVADVVGSLLDEYQEVVD